MSGICGVYHLDGAPLPEPDLAGLVHLLLRRGPDGQGLWCAGPVGLGHTLLWTLPESAPGRLPHACARSGCVITGDVRLDNRDPLLAALGGGVERREACDEQLVLEAYLAWGEACVDHLRGDFAFVIWDPRQRRLFGARDPLGVRPFYYHHAPRRLFAFASEPRSILTLPQVPDRINEGRIADFLVSQLEGIDKTSTFYEQLFRLPPAHCLRVSPDGLRLWRYWTLEPGPELRLPSEEAYAEAFRDVLTESVRSRMRTRGRTASMLSGGMDSGAIVAVASQLLRDAGAGPLPTFSAIARDEADCVESQAIRAALTMAGLEPCTVHPGQLDDFRPELDQLTWNLDEPFDNHMTLPRVMYLAARQRGLNVLLDGIDGDTVLSEGRYLARLVRRGQWRRAYAETRARAEFWQAAVQPSPLRNFVGHVRLAFVPSWLRRFRQRLTGAHQKRARRNIRDSFILPEFAARIDLAGRLAALERHRPGFLLADACREHVLAIDHPYLTVGVERYGRVAAAVGVEPRHPFLDPRMMAFCAALPDEQKLRQGWPKFILRQAMASRLPEAVRWRRGKEHLGSAFTMAYMGGLPSAERDGFDKTAIFRTISKYVNVANLYYAGFETLQGACCDDIYDVVHLAVWLSRRESRQGIGK
jgi:asparagine synthase (glutamine-hydrolysing)